MKRFSHKLLLGATLSSALVFITVGVIFWGGFHTVLAATNTMEFCISCHEMSDNVYQEYIQTTHYNNSSGVRATCPDCHVPKQWQHMIVRKISATNELFHKFKGSIDSKQKFEKKRLQLAEQVWHTMKSTHSRECRNCHQFDAMNMTTQADRASLVHRFAQPRGKTCIDCHQGIAHHLPEGFTPYKGGDDDDHDFYQSQKLPCYQCHEGMAKPDDSW